MNFYRSLIRPALFLSDPEVIHHRVFRLLKIGLKFKPVQYFSRKIFCIEHSTLKRNVFGIDFPNPVGLAAGFDKDAVYLMN